MTDSERCPAMSMKGLASLLLLTSQTRAGATPGTGWALRVWLLLLELAPTFNCGLSRTEIRLIVYRSVGLDPGVTNSMTGPWDEGL